jgi:ubiquinone/menaquinone biosynthesis C-methylase UbiE
MTDAHLAPNHHAEHAPFSGVVGVVAALSMVAGREEDARLAIELSHLAQGEVVLDIGCGPGAAVRRAARLGARVIGIDPAPVMLRFARVLTHTNAVTYRRGTAEQLPVADGEGNVAWSIATVHHWRDIDAGLAEVRRALAPGGQFVAIERRMHAGARGHASHGWTPEQAETFGARCEEHGLVDVRVSEHTHARHSAMAVSGTRIDR